MTVLAFGGNESDDKIIPAIFAIKSLRTMKHTYLHSKLIQTAGAK